MGTSRYKNILKLRDNPDPIEERENLQKEVLKDSTPLPQPLTYKDIDIAFKDWVENDLHMVFEGKDIPTMALFSAQRFSEYMQTWESTDNQQNLLLNFKVVTRENNPQQGTLQGKNMNIPGEPMFLMKRVLMEDKNNRPYYLDYKMKQPFCVDLIYTVSFVTNRYELLNNFNTKIQDKFKAIQCYIRPNGHFLPMKLENIGDESEYSINDRVYFTQSCNVRVMSYIINEEDIITEEVPMITVQMGDLGKQLNTAVVELVEDGEEETISIDFDANENLVTFRMPNDFTVKTIELENIRDYRCKVNDTERELENIELKEGDKVFIYKLKKVNTLKHSYIKLKNL